MGHLNDHYSSSEILYHNAKAKNKTLWAKTLKVPSYTSISGLEIVDKT